MSSSSPPPLSANIMSEFPDVWYQINGRRQQRFQEFSGRYVDDLMKAIKKEEQLDQPSSILVPYVKHLDADEIELTETLLINRKGFGNLIKQYGIDSENPIRVRLPDATPQAPHAVTADAIRSKREYDMIMEQLNLIKEKFNEMDGKKSVIAISRVSRRIFEDVMMELNFSRRTISPSVEQSSRRVNAFQWRDHNENIQSSSYMEWLSVNLVIPQSLEFYNAQSETSLISTSHLSTRYIFNGTMDVAVVVKANIDAYNVAGGLLFGFEMKKDPAGRDVTQAIMELLAASIHSMYPVVMILTDLGRYWQFFWLERGGVVDCKFDLLQAVNFFESIASDTVESVPNPNAAYHGRCTLKDALSSKQPRVPDQQPMVRDVTDLEPIFKRPRIDPMDLVPEDDVADMRDVFDVMAPDEVLRAKVERVQKYVLQSSALESIMNSFSNG